MRILVEVYVLHVVHEDCGSHVQGFVSLSPPTHMGIRAIHQPLIRPSLLVTFLETFPPASWSRLARVLPLFFCWLLTKLAVSDFALPRGLVCAGMFAVPLHYFHLFVTGSSFHLVTTSSPPSRVVASSAHDARPCTTGVAHCPVDCPPHPKTSPGPAQLVLH